MRGKGTEYKERPGWGRILFFLFAMAQTFRWANPGWKRADLPRPKPNECSTQDLGNILWWNRASPIRLRVPTGWAAGPERALGRMGILASAYSSSLL